MMKETTIHEFDKRLQKQVVQAREALKKDGKDYVVQVCGELLKNNPGAYEVRSLLWEALRSDFTGKSSRMNWLRNQSSGIQFKLATRTLLKKHPLEVVRRCDELLRGKQVFPQVFITLNKAAASLDWQETQVLACRAVVALDSEKTAPRLILSEVLFLREYPAACGEGARYENI